MDTATFDTLSAAHTLEAAGIERGHAEAIAHAIRNGQGDLATKADVTAVKGEIAAIASRINALQWVVGIQSAITLPTFAVVTAKLHQAAELLQSDEGLSESRRPVSRNRSSG